MTTSKKRCRLNIEALEDRSLMAVGITPSLVGGVLAIEGTESNDQIMVFQYANRLYVSGFQGSFDASAVQAVVVTAKGGNDVVVLDSAALGFQRLDKLCVVDAGTGDDTVTGGSGVDILFGNAGNDRLHGQDGADLLAGGDGIDVLSGGNGNDLLDGGKDFDFLFGGSGTNFLLDDASDYRTEGVTWNKHVDQLTKQEFDALWAFLAQPAQPIGPVFGVNAQGDPTVNETTITPNNAQRLLREMAQGLVAPIGS